MPFLVTAYVNDLLGATSKRGKLLTFNRFIYYKLLQNSIGRLGGFVPSTACLHKDSHPNILDINTPILIHKNIFMHVYTALHLWQLLKAAFFVTEVFLHCSPQK